MVPSWSESFLFGRSEGRFGPYFRLAGVLFLAFMVVSLAYNLLMEQLVPGWPNITLNSVVRYGAIELPYSDVVWAIHLSVAAIALATATLAVLRQYGLVASLSVGIAPFLGFMVGSTIYFGSFTTIGYDLESPLELLGPIGLFVLYGAIIGTVGFLIGRTVTVLSEWFQSKVAG